MHGKSGWHAYYTPGWLVLAGLLSGALLGWLAGPLSAIPLGMAAGVALGVGADSLLNRHVNGPFEDPLGRD